MTIIWNDILLLAVLSAALHWLVARAEITRPLWSRARGWLAKLLACPACSGFWIGCGLTIVGIQAAAPFALGRPGDATFAIATILANGLLAMFLTPVFEAILLWGLAVSGIEADDDQAT